VKTYYNIFKKGEQIELIKHENFLKGWALNDDLKLIILDM
jgi:hypothetical protein